MNPYVVRAMVAVLTFSIGLAVGHRPHYSRNECHAYSMRGKFLVTNTVIIPLPTTEARPFVSVDTTQTDPLKLAYSSTRPSEDFVGRQRVEFLVERKSAQPIASYKVEFGGTRRETGLEVIQNVLSPKLPSVGAVEPVWFDCDSRETFTVWVSTVRFKDGTQWENPRHRVGQSNL